MKRSRRMSFTYDLDSIESDVRKRGWNLRDFCIRAGISESTWHRWQDTNLSIEPNMGTLRKVYDALDSLPNKKLAEEKAKPEKKTSKAIRAAPKKKRK